MLFIFDRLVFFQREQENKTEYGETYHRAPHYDLGAGIRDLADKHGQCAIDYHGDYDHGISFH